MIRSTYMRSEIVCQFGGPVTSVMILCIYKRRLKGLVMSAAKFFELLDADEVELIRVARRIGEAHAERVRAHDRDATIAVDHLDALRASGYLAAAVPRDCGGRGASLLAIVLAQATLAEFDPSTALGVGMHLMVTGGASWVSAWPRKRRREAYQAVVWGRVF